MHFFLLKQFETVVIFLFHDKYGFCLIFLLSFLARVAYKNVLIRTSLYIEYLQHTIVYIQNTLCCQYEIKQHEYPMIAMIFIWP